MKNRINIGVRHILPIYPLLCIYVSKLVTFDKKKWIKLAVGLLIAFYVIESVLIFPNYLAFFNVAVGGPENAFHYLSDSNIDWGQDLKGLKVWMDENNIDTIKLTYFGMDSKKYRGIDWEEVKCGPSTGLLAVSVTRLIGLTEKAGICLHWLRSQQPIAHIGHSILIYDISKADILGKKDSYCGLICKDKCAKEGQRYVGSAYNQTCKCKCAATAFPTTV